MRHSLKSIADMSEAEWESAFPDEKSCIEWLVACRWPNEKRCPRCGSDLVFPASLYEYRWRCFGCVPDLGYSFDYLTGTIFQDGPRRLRLWFRALHRELTGRSESLEPNERAMRLSLRNAMRDRAFRSIMTEAGPVPRNWESERPEILTDAEHISCPNPTLSADLLR